MNAITSAMCNAATIFDGTEMSAVTVVKDSPDGTDKYYAIAKLSDNRCWMISNYARTYGTYITNISSGTTWKDDTTQQASFYTIPGNTNVINVNGVRACVGNGYATTIADAIDYLADSGNTTDGSIRGCGYLYNWYGATAGTGTSSVIDAIAPGSICPTGWHLPTAYNSSTYVIPNSSWGTDKQEFPTLINTVLNLDLTLTVGPSTVWRGVASGAAYPGNYLSTQGNTGYYWSSSASSSVNVYYFTHRPPNDVRRAVTSRHWGYNVRCILNAN
jgi:uncharacterized protein (TIGR02145 family)